MSMSKIAMTAVCLVGLAAGAQAATIQNGSFEIPATNQNFSTYTAGTASATGITGWTVGSGSVDLVDTLWTAKDGDNSVDLDGSAVGSIYQDIVGLVTGTSYIVTFFMSGNEAGAPVEKTMDVSAGGTTSGYSFSTIGSTSPNIVWEENTFTFTASAATERLTFQSTTNGNFYGPALDDVSIAAVSAVPLPAGGALLLSGLLGLGLLQRKRNG